MRRIAGLRYSDGVATGCPYLTRWGDANARFLAKRRLPPCRLRICGQSLCRNFGKKYDHPELVQIVPR